MQNKNVYLKVKGEEIKSILGLIEAKNKEAKKRKFSVQGLVEFDLKKRLDLTLPDWILTIEAETVQEYFNSKKEKVCKKETVKNLLNNKSLSAEEKLKQLTSVLGVQ